MHRRPSCGWRHWCRGGAGAPIPPGSPRKDLSPMNRNNLVHDFNRTTLINPGLTHHTINLDPYHTVFIIATVHVPDRTATLGLLTRTAGGLTHAGVRSSRALHRINHFTRKSGRTGVRSSPALRRINHFTRKSGCRRKGRDYRARPNGIFRCACAQPTRESEACTKFSRHSTCRDRCSAFWGT